MSISWADLPPELLDIISRTIKIHSDYIHFRAVCAAWRAATLPLPTHLPTQFPWLMLPPSLSHHHSHCHYFFRLLDNKFHALTLPEASYRRRRCGSSNGWLVILEESPSMLLINPLTRDKFNLPPLTAFPNVIAFDFYKIGREYTLRSDDNEVYYRSLIEMRDVFIRKVVLSESPKSNPNFVALVVLNQTGDVAYCRGNDEGWKFIHEANSHCEDVIGYKGLFYAVDKFGIVAVIDVSEDEPQMSYIDTPGQVSGDMLYLVKPNDDELLLIARNLELEVDVAHHGLDIAYKTFQFCVFALERGEQGPAWKQVDSLGDNVLFLGENSSFGLSASDYPGFKGNQIYFTDDYSETNYNGVLGEHDMGVYNMEDGSVEVLPCYPRCPHSRLRWPPPIWISPNPR